MPISGLLVIDKPSGPTSHDIVAQARRLLGAKVGHTGTLDPLATGVLPLLVGRATRLAQFLMADEKEYEAIIELGATTDTYDSAGRVIDRRSVPQLQRADVQAALKSFVGTVRQKAPAYSALKVGGRKLYELARRGEEVSPPERIVQFHRIDLLDHQGSTLKLAILCSSGAYIRSLAHDLGQRVGCGAFLAGLRRTRVGRFDIAMAIRLADMESSWRDKLIPVEEALPDMPRLELNLEAANRVRHGASFAAAAGPGVFQLIDRGSLIAIGRADGDRVHPEIVLQERA
jgi:tRNA pseudouridine55 synthase